MTKKQNKLLLLAAITVAVVIAAAITANLRAPSVDVEKPLLFPQLSGRINDVARIRITGDRTSVILARSGQNWVIENADGYPALFNKVRQNVISLSELRIVDEKTGNPEFYGRLGVKDPTKGDSAAHLVTLDTKTGEQLASLVVGIPQQSSSSKPGLYVRKPDSAQALLVEGQLDLSAEKRNWFDQRLVNIPPDRVKRVRTAPAKGEGIEIYKNTVQQTEFQLKDVAAKQSVIKLILNRMATGLEELRADDVVSLDNFTFPADTTTTTVTTFDGLTATIRLARQEDRHFAHLQFTADPAAQQAMDEMMGKDAPMRPVNVEEEAQLLNERLSGWVYAIPGFKYDDLTVSLEDINKPFRAGQPDNADAE